MRSTCRAVLLAALAMAAFASSLVGQDTIRARPGDTLRVVLPSTPGRYWLNLQGPSSITQYVRRSVVLVAAAAPVAPPPAGGLVLFASDWSTAAGSSVQAVGDGGRWSATGGPVPHANLSVVAVPPGAPAGMVHALQVVIGGTALGVIKESGIGAPMREGETRYWRYYLMADLAPVAAGADDLIHVPQMKAWAGDIPFWDRIDRVTATTFDLQFEARFDNGASEFRHVYQRTLQRGIWYRLELAITRLPADFVRMQRRVYDAQGVLLFSDSDFSCTFHRHTMADAPHAAGANGRFLPAQWAYTDEFMFASASERIPGRLLIGGFLVSSAGWPGPYVRGEGR